MTSSIPYGIDDGRATFSFLLWFRSKHFFFWGEGEGVREREKEHWWLEGGEEENIELQIGLSPG